MKDDAHDDAWDAVVARGGTGGEARNEARAAINKPLCPGCYMVALFNAAVTLAKENGQSLTELGNSMAQAFAELAAGGPDRTESIHVVRDDGVDSARIGAELWERARRGDA
jgi:hypothetical protein